MNVLTLERKSAERTSNKHLQQSYHGTSEATEPASISSCVCCDVQCVSRGIRQANTFSTGNRERPLFTWLSLTHTHIIPSSRSHISLSNLLFSRVLESSNGELVLGRSSEKSFRFIARTDHKTLVERVASAHPQRSTRNEELILRTNAQTLGLGCVGASQPLHRIWKDTRALRTWWSGSYSKADEG